MFSYSNSTYIAKRPNVGGSSGSCVATRRAKMQHKAFVLVVIVVLLCRQRYFSSSGDFRQPTVIAIHQPFPYLQLLFFPRYCAKVTLFPILAELIVLGSRCRGER